MLFVDADCLLESSRLSRNHNAHEYAVVDADNQANLVVSLGLLAGFFRRLHGFFITTSVVERAHVCSFYDAHDAQR